MDDLLTSRRRVLALGGIAAASVATYSARDVLKGVSRSTNGAAKPTVTELEPFRDALRIPPVLRPRSEGLMQVDLIEKNIRLHSQMPATRLWTYEGFFPGPTFEVRSQQQIRIAWKNRLTGFSPVKAVYAKPDGVALGLNPYAKPGSQGTTPRPETVVPPWTAVHLHGGHHHAADDGAADFGITPGSSQLSEYANDTAASQYFYHDHAMSVTSLNVMSGLVGNYLVRDDTEDELRLPAGRYEIPLTIADVNFDTDSSGRINGQLLSKRVLLPAGLSPMAGMLPASVQFMGPYTMVNGTVWPYLNVEPVGYRFRILNVSVARPYQLVVLDDETGEPVKGAMKVIGTDLGLLGRPEPVDKLSLSPAERADVLIDFSAFPGRRLRLVNVQQALGLSLPHGEVMQFRVGGKGRRPLQVPSTLNRGFKQLTKSDIPKDAVERFILLNFDSRGMPQLGELKEVTGAERDDEDVLQIALPDGKRSFKRVATVFEETISFFAGTESWEKWTFLSVGPVGHIIEHPMHIHLMDFQLLERFELDGDVDPVSAGTAKPLQPGKAIPILPEESGWKDTVRVPNNSMVTILGRYGRQTGRFMYHCHILDHEDDGMMRPLAILPPAILKLHSLQMGMSTMEM